MICTKNIVVGVEKGMIQNTATSSRQGLNRPVEHPQTLSLQAQPGFFGIFFLKKKIVVKLSVWTLAGCKWRAAAALAALQCKSPLREFRTTSGARQLALGRGKRLF